MVPQKSHEKGDDFMDRLTKTKQLEAEALLLAAQNKKRELDMRDAELRTARNSYQQQQFFVSDDTCL